MPHDRVPGGPEPGSTALAQEALEARWTAVCGKKRIISRFGSTSRAPHRPPRARQVFGLVKIICKTGDAFSTSFRRPRWLVNLAQQKSSNEAVHLRRHCCRCRLFHIGSSLSTSQPRLSSPQEALMHPIASAPRSKGRPRLHSVCYGLYIRSRVSCTFTRKARPRKGSANHVSPAL